MLDVEQIKLQLSLGVFHRGTVLIFHLRPAGYSRAHGVPLCEKRQLRFQHFAKIWLLRTWAHQAHFAVQNIEELRQLIKPILTDESANTSDTAVFVSGPTGS